MKRVVVIVMLIMCTVAVSAQQWSFTPEAGMNVTNYKGATPKIGFKGGVAVAYTFGEGVFGIQSGLYYVQRGTGHLYLGEAYGKMKDEKGEWQDASIHFYPGGFMGYQNYGYGSGLFPREMQLEGMRVRRSNMRRDYLQLPVMARLNGRFGKDVRLHLAAGPYLAMGLGGTSQVRTLDMKGIANELTTTLSTEDPFGKHGIRRFDWGATLHAGVEVKRFAFNIGYDLGLGQKYRYDDVDVKYHTVSFTVGYTF